MAPPGVVAPPAVAPAAPAPAAAPAAAAAGLTFDNRPDWLPEKFFNPETKGPRIKELATSYRELEGRIGMSREAIRTEIEHQRNVEIAARRPAAPEGYKIAVSDDFVKTNDGLQFLVGKDAQPADKAKPFVRIDDGDPLVSWWRSTAHELGLGQDGFQAGIEQFVGAQIGKLKANQTAAAAFMDAEVKKLGERATERLDAVDKWGKANLTEAEYGLVRQIASTALGVQLVEKFMTGVTPGVPNPSPNEGGPDRRSSGDAKKMAEDPRYWDPMRRDTEYVKQVDAAFKRQFSGQVQVA